MTDTSKLNFENLHNSVIACGLCTRCGLCAGICPLQVIGFDKNGFPTLTGECKPCGLCSACCPGGKVDFPGLTKQIFGEEYDPDNLNGHVEKYYVAHSNQNKVRESGASGGVVTALLLHLLEKKKIDGAIVVGMDKKHPYQSAGLLATSREEILSAASSKYSITPSMEVMRFLRKTSGRFAVVGLPCQIHGLRKLEEVDPYLSAKIVCYLGLMCHYNLEPVATTDLLSVKRINKADVQRFQYRGGEWPGRFQIKRTDGKTIPLFFRDLRFHINVLFRLYAAKRCYMCLDALADFADLSFGDFWANDYSGPLQELKKSTLVLQRTSRGSAVISEALAAGAIEIRELPAEKMSKRILRMAREKKQTASALILKKIRGGEAVPDYGFNLQVPPLSGRKIIVKYQFYQFLRKKIVRKIILWLLFSKAGILMIRLNSIRQNIYSPPNLKSKVGASS